DWTLSDIGAFGAQGHAYRAGSELVDYGAPACVGFAHFYCAETAFSSSVAPAAWSSTNDTRKLIYTIGLIRPGGGVSALDAFCNAQVPGHVFRALVATSATPAGMRITHDG